MKKLMIAFLVLTMVFALAACGGAPAANNGADSTANGADNTQEDPNLIDFGDYKALYKGGEIVKDYNDADALVLTFDFTNNSSESKSFGWSFYYYLHQAGEELSSAIVYTNDDLTESVSDSEFIQVEAGETMEVKISYELVNLTDDVTIDFSDLLDEHSDTLTVSMADCAQG